MWNVRSMNQGKLEVVKQEMPRANIDILVISELKWTGISEFNSDDHYISFCGQESFRRNSPHNQQKNPKCGTWVQSQNQKYDLSLFPRQAIQHYSYLSLCYKY